jgi:hypothetical protein
MNTCRHYDTSASQRPSPKGYKLKSFSSTKDGPEDREASQTPEPWKKPSLQESMRATQNGRQQADMIFQPREFCPNPKERKPLLANGSRYPLVGGTR